MTPVPSRLIHLMGGDAGPRRLISPVPASLSGLFPGGWDDDNAPEDIRRLNWEFAVVVEGGRAMVWRLRREGDRIVYERLGERDFLLLLRNQTTEVRVGFKTQGDEVVPETERVPLGRHWLAHPKRRTYERVIFDPTPGLTTPPGVLNLWRGYSVQPAPGRWDQFDAHLRQVICGGDDQRYQYLRKWLARTLQRPDQRGEVAVVLRGAKGSGKGTLGNALVRLHGQHGLQISSPRYLVGNFNYHLRDLSFLFVDEAFWAGDRQGESVLKALITEPSIVVEAKYRDAVAAPNRLSILMASNSDWVVPASRDERRYFVLDVAGTHVNDFAYFTAIHEELETGGLAAFLYDMLAEDLTGFDHRNVPQNEALEEQIIQTFSPMEQWWYERLTEGAPVAETGDLPTDVHGDWRQGEITVIGDWGQGEIEVVKDALHNDLLAYCDKHRIRMHQRDTKKALGWALKKWLPTGWPKDTWTGGPRGEGRYRIPSLSACRRAFSRGHEGLFSAEEDEPSF